MEAYYRYFDRQVMLWGEETQRALQKKRIVIVGAGGLGSSLAIALGASGIGHIDLVGLELHLETGWVATNIGQHSGWKPDNVDRADRLVSERYRQVRSCGQ